MLPTTVGRGRAGGRGGYGELVMVSAVPPLATYRYAPYSLPPAATASSVPLTSLPQVTPTASLGNLANAAAAGTMMSNMAATIPGYAAMYGLETGMGATGSIDMSGCKRLAFTQPANTNTTNSLGYSVSNLLGIQGLTVPTYPIPVGL